MIVTTAPLAADTAYVLQLHGQLIRLIVLTISPAALINPLAPPVNRSELMRRPGLYVLIAMVDPIRSLHQYGRSTYRQSTDTVAPSVALVLMRASPGDRSECSPLHRLDRLPAGVDQTRWSLSKFSLFPRFDRSFVFSQCYTPSALAPVSPDALLVV